VLDVAATNVEQPADRIRRGQEHRILVVLLERVLHLSDLLGRASARELD
jgi:hypothetical protein